MIASDNFWQLSEESLIYCVDISHLPIACFLLKFWVCPGVPYHSTSTLQEDLFLWSPFPRAIACLLTPLPSFQPALWQIQLCVCSSLMDSRQCSTHSTVHSLKSRSPAHMPAEGAGDVCTELMWLLNAHSGLVCAKGMISLSSMCALSRTDVVPFGEGDIGTMCLHLSMKPGEYSYFSPRTLSMWAGPEHWRFKPRHKGTYLETVAHTLQTQLLPGPAYLWRWVPPEL